MGRYWEINGDVVTKKNSFKEVEDVLVSYGMDIDKVEDEKISFSFYGYAYDDEPADLDNDLRQLVKDGEFTAKCDEDNSTSCYRYGREPYYEKTNVLEYYPSQIEEFVKTLPKDFVDAVVRTYTTNADGDTNDNIDRKPTIRHYDCSHDCDALYEAYEKGKKSMYMKKWWLEHEFHVDGHRVQFRGWINTTAERKEDFPDMVYGTFWARQDPALDGDGMRGMFRLDGEESDEGNYVFGSVYPVYLADGVRFSGVRDRETADLVLRANEPLAAYPKFEARIEDCVDLSGTYIVEY